MSATETEGIQELFESFQELSQEEQDEFVRKMVRKGEVTLPPPPRDWYYPPWFPGPGGDFPIDLESGGMRGGQRTGGGSTTTIRLTSRADLREEDDDDIPIDVDITSDSSDDPEQLELMSRSWGEWVQKGSEFVGKALAGDAEGLGINVENATFHNCEIEINVQTK